MLRAALLASRGSSWGQRAAASMEALRQRKGGRAAASSKAAQRPAIEPFGLALVVSRAVGRRGRSSQAAATLSASLEQSHEPAPAISESAELDLSLAAAPAPDPQPRRSARGRRPAASEPVAGLASDTEPDQSQSKKTAKRQGAAAAADAQADVKPKAKRARKASATPGGMSKKQFELTVGTSHDAGVWSEESMQAAMAHLAEADPKLTAVVAKCGAAEPLWPKPSTNVFASLARTIIAQQLAITAAKKIYGRFLTTVKCDSESHVQPADVLAVPWEELKACGLSGMKTNYIVDLAKHFQSGELSDAKISAMDYQELIAELTKVKGIGRWTVDMYAMFHMGRRDVLPVGDLGVRNGMKQLYGLKEAPSPLEMERLTECWRPFRSLGSFYMWRVIEKGGASNPSKVPAATADAPAADAAAEAGSNVPL